MSLADRTCEPCRGGVPPLTAAQIAPLAAQLPAWEVVDGHHLRRAFAFPDFRSALALVVAVGEEAEAQGHHPDIALGWGRVVVEIHTHKIDGLAEADFVLAARIDRLAGRPGAGGRPCPAPAAGRPATREPPRSGGPR